MRRPVLFIFVNAMILIVIFALLTQSLVIVQRIAVTRTLAGRVEVQRSGSGSFKALAQGDPIKTGDVVRAAGDGTAEFKWADGTRWKILPNTQITVKKSSYNIIKKVERSELRLTAGKVFIRIIKALNPASQFEVETPTAVAAVRGTIFSVEVKNGETQVKVFKGRVQVSSPGRNNAQQQAVKPGEAAVSRQTGTLATMASPTANAEFAQQPSIIQPELRVTIKRLNGGNQALLRGSTEAGDTVTIKSTDQPKGEVVKPLGNGRFLKRVTLHPGNNVFTITSTDRYGAKTTVTRTVPGSAKDIKSDATISDSVQ